jgi:hypothetical protein
MAGRVLTTHKVQQELGWAAAVAINEKLTLAVTKNELFAGRSVFGDGIEFSIWMVRLAGSDEAPSQKCYQQEPIHSDN